MKDAAIQEAFYEGAERGIKYIVEKFHEHPAITSEICRWIDDSWDKGQVEQSFDFSWLRLIKVI